MTVAVDIRFDDKDYQNFIYQVFSRIVKVYPQHSFIFIIDKPLDQSPFTSENVTAVEVSEPKIRLLAQVIVDKKLSSILKRNKVDVFITNKILSATKVPQCLIFTNTASKNSLQKAKVILTFSNFSKENILNKNKIESDKVKVLNAGIDAIFQPIEFDERELLKEKYADGKEYFLCEETSANKLLTLLKAYSIFKKRQKSSMQLVIATQHQLDAAFIEQLNFYKFKNDVKVFDKISLNELAKITAGAYAKIFLSEINAFHSPALESMQCNVPVITINKGASIEVCADAALYVEPADNKDIAERMMLIFKDEKLRNDLIEKGKEQTRQYTWDNAASEVWASIDDAAK